MEKKIYQRPTMKVVKFQQCVQLLAGSPGLGSPSPFDNGGNPIGS